MKIFFKLFLLLFVFIFSLGTQARTPFSLLTKTCEEVLNSSNTGFSPAQLFLKKRKTALLGKRYDPVAAARGGGSNRTRDWTAPESPVIRGLSLTQSKVEVSYLLDLLDPLPGQGTSIPTKRKITIQEKTREGINYVYTDKQGSILILGETFQAMAEMISLSRSDFHQGRIKFELTNEGIQEWFALSLQLQMSELQTTTLSSNILALAYKQTIGQKIRDYYANKALEYMKESDSAYYRPLELLEKASTQQEIQQNITVLELMVGRRTVDPMYDFFVKSVVALLDNPDATHITEVSEDRQIALPIDLTKIRNTFQLVDMNYRSFFMNHVLEKDVPSQLIENLQAYVPDPERLLPEFRAYREAIALGRPAKKNPAVLIALAYLGLKEQMSQENFRELIYATHKVGHDHVQNMKKFNEIFPNVGTHFNLSGWDSFQLIRTAMIRFPYEVPWILKK